MAISLIVCIVGALAYIICKFSAKYAEIAELGRLAFLAGLLAWLLGR